MCAVLFLVDSVSLIGLRCATDTIFWKSSYEPPWRTARFFASSRCRYNTSSWTALFHTHTHTYIYTQNFTSAHTHHRGVKKSFLLSSGSRYRHTDTRTHNFCSSCVVVLPLKFRTSLWWCCRHGLTSRPSQSFRPNKHQTKPRLHSELWDGGNG